MALLTEAVRRRHGRFTFNGSHSVGGSVTCEIGPDTTTFSIPGTHYEASYLAAIMSLALAERAGLTHVELSTPSDLVKNQAQGMWECRAPNLRPLWNMLQLLLTRFDEVRFT